MEKQPCNRLRKEHKRSGYDQSPYSENTKGNVVAMADTIVFLCTVILCSKSIQGRGKAIRSVPGYRLNLSAHTLGCNGSCAECRNHSCEDHGDHAVDHALNGCWKTNAEDVFIKFSGIT